MFFANGNKVSQVICLSCLRRWEAIRPIETWLDQLECPNCNKQGTAIETGEICDTEEVLKKACSTVE